MQVGRRDTQAACNCKMMRQVTIVTIQRENTVDEEPTLPVLKAALPRPAPAAAPRRFLFIAVAVARYTAN